MIPAVESEKPRTSRAFRGIMETAGIEPAPCSHRLSFPVNRPGDALDIPGLAPKSEVSMQVDLTPAAKGTRAEAMVLAHLAEAGYTVLIPFGVARYDLAFDAGDGIKTVQCKLGRLWRGAIHWSTSSSVTRFSGSNPGHRRLGYRGVVDYFGVWCPETGKAYLVPPEKVGDRNGYLRVDYAAGRRNVEWAATYEVRRLGVDSLTSTPTKSAASTEALF